ncbi:MAG: CotH kinase family protein [Clostridia bacterium]|nr:CotH kinase family protein [Clostridia bacterium]
MKKSIFLLLTALLLFSLCAGAYAAGGIDVLKINPYGEDEAAIDTVSWYVSSGKYFLFLPADTDLTAAKVYFTASGDVTVDGAPVVSGDSAAAFTAGTHTLSCGDATYPLTVLQSSALPTVFIETASGSLNYLLANKENKEPATIRVYENGELTLDKELKQIKGRGNSTWTECPKKPFNIKFDKKTALLGMPKAKKWSLLANYKDDSAIKTPAGLELGRTLGIPYTSECRNADLYLNGEYYGNFSVCESVEVGENRVEITDLEKANETANPGVEIEALPRGGTGANGSVQNHTVKGSMKWVNIPNNPADISGGYLLELDFGVRYNEEVSGFVSNYGQWVVVKSPEYASEAEVRYIAALYNEAEEALLSSNGYNSRGKYYTEYFDMETLAKTYLFIELQKSLDTAISSFYFYKDAGSDLLVAAPVWDFDRGFYTPEWRCASDMSSPNGWHSSSFSYSGSNGDPFDTETFLSLCFRHEDFRELAANTWKSTVLGTAPAQVDALFSGHYAQNAASRQMNLVRWKYASAASPLTSATSGGDSYFSKVSSFVHNRLAVLDAAFNSDLAMLYYDANGGSRHIFNREIVAVGGKVTVLGTQVHDSYIAAPAGKTFQGWNTKADGTGKTYQPGDKIQLNAKTTKLYAMWDAPQGNPTNPTNPSQSDNNDNDDFDFLQWLRHIFKVIGDFWRRVFKIK